VHSREVARAVEHFVEAGAGLSRLHAYIMIGHPVDNEQQVEESVRFAHRLGIRLMLSELCPIPGTPTANFAGAGSL
jgi:radical SAM superfamily enzyme YgiQ (UPF0313 family)